MPQENIVFYNPAAEELDDELEINFAKIFHIVWSRKVFLVKVFCAVLTFFIILTFIMPKQYKVTADLYLNKNNSSNLVEINPYVIDESSGSVLPMGTDKAINNEMELIKSSLVLDKVIRDNDIKYKKKFGIFPNKREGQYVSAKAFYKKGKKLKLENVKNTNVISITYTAKKPELAYGVVSSLITNYIELHKEINSEKSKSDKKLIESEYAKTKAALDKKINQAGGIPVQAMSGTGNLSALSAFSKAASNAMGTLKSQYIAGEKSQIAISEESQKLNKLASKLEWAQMVEQMSDSTKVLIINEPQEPLPSENSSPKLLINIILGCIFGGIASLGALIAVEVRDKNLAYSMLTEHIIFDGLNKLETLKTEIFSFSPKKVLLVLMTQLPNEVLDGFKGLSNLEIVYPNMSAEFIGKISSAEKVVLMSKVGATSSDAYKTIRKIIQNQKKEIAYDVVV